MRIKLPDQVEKCRVRMPQHSMYYTDRNSGANGWFILKYKGPQDKVVKTWLMIVASGGNPDVPWEHVSVTVRNEARCPTWDEMSFVKDCFWHEDEAVMQLHVPKDDHISCHPYCLHLWKPFAHFANIPRPPASAVGPTKGTYKEAIKEIDEQAAEVIFGQWEKDKKGGA